MPVSELPAKIIIEGDDVFFLKRCHVHGVQKSLVSTDQAYYKLCREYLKPGDRPLNVQTRTELGCPYDCGLCPDHEQHSCLALIEVNDEFSLPFVLNSLGELLVKEGRNAEAEELFKRALELQELKGSVPEIASTKALIEALDGTEGAGAKYGRWLEAAYLDAPSAEEATALVEEIRRDLPGDWFTDTLVRRIATRVDDQALQSQAEAIIDARGRSLLTRVRALTGTGAALLAASLVVAWGLRRSRRDPRVADAPLPPPWRGLDGAGLFFRAAFAYLLIPAAVVLLLPRMPLVTAVMGLIGGLPTLWWARRYLHARGRTLRETFGLTPRAGRLTRLLGWGLVLLTVSMVGESLLYAGLSALGVSSHWADGFLEEFLWGSPAAVAAGTLDGVVWAPIFEELAFRGLLYPTLRLRLPAWLAALLSAAIFAGAHGYGVQGFAAVTWSGMVWALGYERTRSLLPGMLAHAASNLLATSSFLVLLRF